MSYTISNVKDDIAALSHGTDVGHIQNFNEMLWRAGRKVLAKLDPRETHRIQNLTNPIHDEVYNYALPSDTKRIVDIRPQTNRGRGDKPRGRYGRYFDIEKALQDDIYSVQHDDGSKFIRISKDITPSPTTIHSMNSTTSNGTWSAGSNATNLTEDSQFFISGSKSLNFDLSSGSSGDTGHIQNSDMSQVDLETHEDISTLFVWVYFPDSSIITNAKLRWGSLTSAHWEGTETDQHDGTAFRNGWNLLGFSWNGATKTGSPDSSAIDFVRVTITYDGTAETDIRVDNIVSSLGEIWEIVYYSNLLFRTSGGTWREKPTSDSDLVNLDQDSYNIFLHEAWIEVSRQTAGEDASFDIAEAEKELYGTAPTRPGLYEQYKSNYPSEAARIVGFYYTLR